MGGNAVGYWDNHIRNISIGEAESFTEPFVVIEWSESRSFSDYERLTFADADARFKEVEAAELAERAEQGKYGGYRKTSGVIFYKDSPDDTELSTYQFKYDIGDYSGDKSGLYNHIQNFWTNVQRGLDGVSPYDSYIRGGSYTQEDVDGVFRMLGILRPAEQQHEADIAIAQAKPDKEPERSELPEQSEQSEQQQVYQGYPMWRDYQAISAEHKDKILFYRLGDFYEVMGNDANAVAKFLNLTVAGRDVGLDARVPMVGVPAHALDDYVNRLVTEGFAVALRHGQDMVEIRSNATPENAVPEKPAKNEIPVYKETLAVANEKGEREQYIESRNLNNECGQAIDAALRNNSTPGQMAGTQYVDAKQAIQSVIDEYGAERVAWVLAGNVKAADYDGRISQATRIGRGILTFLRTALFILTLTAPLSRVQ